MEPIHERGRPPARRLDLVACWLLAGFAVYLALLAALAWVLVAAPPDTTFHLFGRTLGPADLGRRLVRRGLVLGLLLPALLAIELACEGWDNSSLRRLLTRRSRSAWSDLAVFFFWLTPGHVAVRSAFSLGVVLAPAEWLHRTLADATGFSIELAALPVAAQVTLFFFVYSFFEYWQHRLDHTPWFWPLHRYHHAADEFCMLTSVRLHPAAFTSLIAGLIPGVLVGISEDALFWFLALSGAVHYVMHSRIDSDFGWFGRWVLQSPLHHRLHHRLAATEPTANYSLIPLWDRLFGTWSDAAVSSTPIGVATPYRHGLWIAPDLLRDYAHFWLALAGRYRDESGYEPASAARFRTPWKPPAGRAGPRPSGSGSRALRAGGI
jgi:sterol desaturase/sphingolipid hydroxylase (fatty acid hydroxylase superfamily)